MRRVVSSIAVLFLCILAAIAGATPDCAWVLWVETPEGSDQWNIPKVPESRFTARDDCQRRADDLNAFEATMTKAHGTSREAHDDRAPPLREDAGRLATRPVTVSLSLVSGLV